MEMDDFDFKPITKGLGFDKKTEEQKFTPNPAPKMPGSLPATRETKAPLTSSSSKSLSDAFEKDSLPMSFLDPEQLTIKPNILEKPVDWNTNPPKTSRAISDMMNALPPSIDFDDKKTKKSEPRIYQPVGRVEYNTPLTKPEITAPLPAVDPSFVPGTSLDVTLNNTLEKAFPKEGFRRPFFHQTVEVKPQFTPVTASFTSAILDLLVITGLTALFLVSLIAITKVDLLAVVTRTNAPLSVYAEIGAIFFGVYLLYYMCTRGFWGSTLGDWAFDMQLGLEKDRLEWFYPVQVVARMIAIAATGFIILPILSFVFQKDLAYYFSGVRLYTKNY